MEDFATRKNNPEFMKEYLKHAFEFEKLVFMWSKAVENTEYHVNDLRSQKQQLNEQKNRLESALGNVDAQVEKERQSVERTVRFYNQRKKIDRAILIISIVLVFVGVISAFIAYSITDDFSVSVFISVCSIFPLVLYLLYTKLYFPAISGAFQGFLGSFLGFKGNEETEEQKKRRMKIEEESLNDGSFERIAKNRKDNLKNEIISLDSSLVFNQQSISMAKINLSDIKESLNAAKKTLSEIYSLNVLPAKYRSFNAVATLYEYLENGVCTTVQGHGGIYDTYEYHTQIGAIITRLDVIIQKLEAIRQNQEMLYDAISESNDLLEKIDKNITAGNQAFAEYSTASLAYQRQQAASLQWQNWNTYHS